MSKKTSFTALVNNKAASQEEPAGPPPVSAFLHTITGNPDNPRDVDELELDELIQSFKEVGQLQPVLSVSRDVYLRHKPHHADAIGDAQYVILGGNRRLEAARTLGWARIDIQLRDDLGNDDGFIDEAVIIENIHRKALAPMKEAAFLQVMVERYGSQGKVAQRIGKTQAYVSQRLSLLKLEPELQQAVDAGELKVKEARKIAAVPRSEQRAAWQEQQDSRPPSPAPTHNPVMTQEPARVAEPAPVAVADPEPARVPLAAVPDPRPEQQDPPVQNSPEPRPESKGPTRMPWANGPAAMDIVIDHMIKGERPGALGRYVERVGGPVAFAGELAEGVSVEDRRQLAEALLKQLEQ